MKPLNFIKLILLMLVLFIGKNNIFADPVNVPNPGDLSTLIDESEKYQISELTLTGDLNGDDIAFIRDMMGSNGSLATLNLADASFVAGGQDAIGGDEMKDNYLAALMFAMCEKLEKITLPSNLDSGGFVSFLMSNNLKEIHIAESNATFTTVDGVLFSKDKTEILTYPPNKAGSSYNLPEELTSIMHSAFRDSRHLKHVHFGNNVTLIDYYAFTNASALEEIDIPEGITVLPNEVFKNCTSLVDVSLPNGLISIGEEAFQNTVITSIAIPATVNEIGENAFKDCNNLSELKVFHQANKILSYNEHWGLLPWSQALYVPQGSFNAYSNADGWKDFSQIIEFEIQQEEPEIEPRAETINVEIAGTLSNVIDAADKNKITELTLTGYLNSEDILFIREMAGSGINGQPTNGNLQILNMSGASIVASDELYFSNPEVGDFYTEDNVLGSAMFLFTKLTHVTIPTTTTSAGILMFAFCDNLESITVPDANTGLKSVDGVLYDYNMENIYAYPQQKTTNSFSLPASVKAIKFYAFQGSQYLKTVVLPEDLETIEQGAFYAATQLESINIPEGITEIPNFFVSDCTNLSSILLPDGITSIGDNAFDNTGLHTIIFPATVTSLGKKILNIAPIQKVQVLNETPISINAETFLNIPASCVLIVPEGSKSAYESANYWKDFTIIKEDLGEIVVEKHVATAGTLSNLIDEADKYQITGLTLTGYLNGDDILYIREMAGSGIQGQPTEGNLQILDISGASIVAGGGMYLDNPDVGQMYTNNNELGAVMFGLCRKLEKITLPSNLTSGGFVTFLMCNNLEEIIIDENNAAFTTIDGILFSKDKTIIYTYPENKTGEFYALLNGVTTISHSAFRQNRHLETLVLPASVNNIDEYAFNNCAALKEINIPEGLTELKGEVFKDCSNLQNISLPNSLETIGSAAFQNCNNLQSIALPHGLISIGQSAFMDAGLKSLNIPETVTSIGEAAFLKCDLSEGVELPEGLEKINVQLFAYSNLQSIVLPESITKIDTMAFAACIALNSIALSENLESISEEAFENCGGINSLRLPASLTYIGEKAFWNCAGLEQLVVFNPTPIAINANTFENVPKGSCILIVPDESVNAYQADPVWSQFMNIIDFTTDNPNLKSKQTFVFADNDAIVIKGAREKSKVRVYSITGSLMKSFTTNTNHETVEVLSNGMYIVNVDDKIFKVVF